MATIEEKIRKSEDILRDLNAVRDIIGDEHYWRQVDYELKYLKPLYDELRKKQK